MTTGKIDPNLDRYIKEIDNTIRKRHKEIELLKKDRKEIIEVNELDYPEFSLYEPTEGAKL